MSVVFLNGEKEKEGNVPLDCVSLNNESETEAKFAAVHDFTKKWNSSTTLQDELHSFRKVRNVIGYWRNNL